MNYRKIIGIVFCLIGFSVLGQAQFRYGVKGGMNISSVNFNKDDLFSSQSITGYQVGVTSEYIVPKLGIGLMSPFCSDRKDLNNETNIIHRII